MFSFSGESGKAREMKKSSRFFHLLFFLFAFVFIAGADVTPKPNEVRIVFYGDTRVGHDIHREIIGNIVRLKPTMVVHTGDAVSGVKSNDWTMFSSIVSPLLGLSPLYMARGNHDTRDKYMTSTALSRNEPWYSVTAGNIRVIILDSNEPIGPGTPQNKWLIGDLAAEENRRAFIVAVFHHPIVSSSAGGHEADEKGWSEVVTPLFYAYGVDMVVNGHVHAYERLTYQNLTYVITGGGGAPLYAMKEKHPASITFLKAHHYAVLTESGGVFTLDSYDLSGNTIDHTIIDNIDRND